MNRWLLLTAGGVLTLGITGCVDRQAQKESKATEQVVNNPVKSVSVQSARLDSISDEVEITGDVTASDDTTIGSKTNNRVVSVLVKDGDLVTKGQLLATLDDTGAQAQLKQAVAQVSTALATMASARSQLDQANRNLAIGPHKSTVQVLSARAAVQASQRALDKLVAGARPEERRQAIANLDSAKSNLELQTKQLERTKKLVAEGALSGQSLDQQQSSYDQAVAQVKSAQEAVNINANGSRQEDIDSSRAELKQAMEALHNAEDQKKLDPLLQDQVDAANAQIESSRAQLVSARAQIQIANQAIADTKIYAPFNGRISGRPIQVGTVAGASTAIVRIVGGDGVYFNGQIPSTNIDLVHVGQHVKIHVDGLPNKTFSGQIVGVNPLADNVARLFSVRVQIVGSTEGVQPGMFARGAVTVRTIPNAVVIPTVAIVSRGDSRSVFVVDGSKAKEVKITIGLAKGDTTQVIGLPADAKVVTAGQDTLVDGAQVTVKAIATVLNDTSNTNSGGKS